MNPLRLGYLAAPRESALPHRTRHAAGSRAPQDHCRPSRGGRLPRVLITRRSEFAGGSTRTAALLLCRRVPRRRPPFPVVLSALLLQTAVAIATPPPPVGSALASAALRQCDAVPDRPSEADQPALARAKSLADQAVAADPRDAVAHFAVFCTLAKQTYLTGFSLRSLLAVRTLHREIDTTLTLAPDYVDALVAKAGFVLNLPRLLGGDPREAETLLRRAVSLDPGGINARLYLAEALDARGDRRAAVEQATLALELARTAGDAARTERAQTLLTRLNR